MGSSLGSTAPYLVSKPLKITLHPKDWPASGLIMLQGFLQETHQLHFQFYSWLHQHHLHHQSQLGLVNHF